MKLVKPEYNVWMEISPTNPNPELLVGQFIALGDAVSYAIWRAKENNEPGHTFKVRNKIGYVLFVKEHEVYAE